MGSFAFGRLVQPHTCTIGDDLVALCKCHSPAPVLVCDWLSSVVGEGLYMG